jgi:hypothetical protein
MAVAHLHLFVSLDENMVISFDVEPGNNPMNRKKMGTVELVLRKTRLSELILPGMKCTIKSETGASSPAAIARIRNSKDLLTLACNLCADTADATNRKGPCFRREREASNSDSNSATSKIAGMR